MKLIFRQYLESLKEREELDEVLPNLLSELGFNVISRPSRGPRQYGVDIAATGVSEKGEKKLYLFSVKKGNLTRQDWDSGSPQDLRRSINEIVEFYIPVNISEEHRNLKVVICLCFGGEIRESMRGVVTQFLKGKTTENISFEEWNGDYISNLLVEGILKEQLLEKGLQTHFQKSIAMIDEPEISYRHFCELSQKLTSNPNLSPDSKLTSLRQLYICLWVLFVWSRDADNLEAAYRASEVGIIKSWAFVNREILEGAKGSNALSLVFSELAELHFAIWDALIGKKILASVSVKHGLSQAVGSPHDLDVNLKLFEILGRLSMRGLWLLWSSGFYGECAPAIKTEPERHNLDFERKASALAESIVELINNNPILSSPIADHQATAISMTLLFLSLIENRIKTAGDYASTIINKIGFALRTHGRYPSCDRRYTDLLGHPKESSEEYRAKKTAGSTLFPILALWSSSTGNKEISASFTAFLKDEFPNCNLQLWLSGESTETELFQGRIQHGLALSDIPLTDDCQGAVDIINAECNSDVHYKNLSAIKLGHWPILILACKHYHMPLPPNLWMGVLNSIRDRMLKSRG